MRYLVLALMLAAGLHAEARTEEGEIAGAKFRIDIPENFNGTLLLFCHGYTPVSDSPKLNAMAKALVDNGYAVAQSAYSASGWAVEEGMRDSEALRAYFWKKYGKPKRTIVGGYSMGGQITIAMAESHPEYYDGALPMCAMAAPAYEFFQRRLFDLRIVFDYYFPGVFPPADQMPADYRLTRPTITKMVSLFEGSPEKAAAIRQYFGFKTNSDAAFGIDLGNEILGNLRKRTGGNPFDNRSTIYVGSPDDNALNDGVKRYVADEKAAAYVKANASITGNIKKPMLELHTTYDPLITPTIVNTYTSMVQRAKAESLYAVQYVKRDGHCTFKPDEVLKAVNELSVWVEQGTRPAVGVLQQ